MTLVVALQCTDGAILASDSQSTESTGNVRSAGQKVFPLTEHAVWGASGNGQIIAEIRDRLTDITNSTPVIMGQGIVNKVRPVLDRHYKNFINVPNQPPSSPGTSVLACGVWKETPWIVEVDAHCQYSQYETKGYHAIGSGAEPAQYAIAVLSHFQTKNNSLEYGKMVVYRVMDTVIQTSAYHVGPPIQMWTVNQSGVHQLIDEELAQLQDAVATWKAVERDTLESVLSGRLATAPSIPQMDGAAPMPPEIEA